MGKSSWRKKLRSSSLLLGALGEDGEEVQDGEKLVEKEGRWLEVAARVLGASGDKEFRRRRVQECC
jgi:hypothetical protein